MHGALHRLTSPQPPQPLASSWQVWPPLGSQVHAPPTQLHAIEKRTPAVVGVRPSQSAGVLHSCGPTALSGGGIARSSLASIVAGRSARSSGRTDAPHAQSATLSKKA